MTTFDPSNFVIAYSTCGYCARIIELTAEPDAAWTIANGPGLSGRNPECPAAPNPDEGPMPGHVPGVIAWRDQQPPPPPAAPYPPPVVPWIPHG